MWREVLHTLATGEATVHQINVSVTDALGLRWASDGPILTIALGGGQGGMAHILDDFGDAFEDPTLIRVPSPALSDALRARFIEACKGEGSFRDRDHLALARDP